MTSANPRPRAVLTAVVMAYLGGALLIFLGLLFAIGTGDGTFLGEPVEDVDLSGTTVSLDAAVGVGIGMTAAGVLLAVLTVFAQRGSRGARLGLTALGAVAVAAQCYVIATGNGLSGLVGVVWIVVALLLLWTDRATAWFSRRR